MEGGRWRVIGKEVGKVRGGQRSDQAGPLWRLRLSFKWNENPRDGVRQWSDMIWFLFQQDPLGQDGGSETSVLFTWITKEQTSQVLAPPWAPQACAHGRTPLANPPCHEQKATADNCQVSKIRREPRLQIHVWCKWRRNTVNHPARWSSSGLPALDIQISLASLHQKCQHPGTCAKPSRKHYAWIFPFSKKEKHDFSSSLLHSDRSSLQPRMARWRHQKHS